MISRRWLFHTLAVCTIALAISTPLWAEQPLKVVASFSILGDMVQQVGGDQIKVTTLVGADADGHVYQPTPADARTVARADLLVVNGLSFEGWIDRLIQASGYKGSVITATDGIQPQKMQVHDTDPHAWQNLSNARIYIRNIVKGLSLADPAGASVYKANAVRYLEKLDAVEAEVVKTISSIPPQRRKVVTLHDAFGYFEAAYGLAFLAPVGISTESEASAADVAKLIRQIRKEQIPAVFIENISDPRLLEQITRETGARIGGVLYSDALSSTDGPASTYLDMFLYNTHTLAEALK